MKYVIYVDQNGFWRWRFVAANNEIVASGEAYHNREDCLHAIGLLKASSNAAVYEQK